MFPSVTHLCHQALRSQWDKEAESTQSTLKTSHSDTQRSLAAAQAELAGAHESLTQTNKALTEAQTASSQTQSELRESWARLQELQASSQESNQKLEEELKQAWGDRDAAAREWPSVVLTLWLHKFRFIILIRNFHFTQSSALKTLMAL